MLLNGTNKVFTKSLPIVGKSTLAYLVGLIDVYSLNLGTNCLKIRLQFEIAQFKGETFTSK